MKRSPLSREDVLRLLQELLPHLKQQYGVSRLALFGSYARGKPRLSSDVDVLVELDRPLGLEFVDMVLFLEEKLGRKVEVATFDTLQSSLQQPRYRELALDVQRTLTDVVAAAQ